MSKQQQPKAANGHVVKYAPDGVVGDQGTLKALMNSQSIADAIKDLAPRHLKPERMIRMVLAAASRNQTLLKCTQKSILKSAIEASALGLDCSGLLGRGYMVPYKNKYLTKSAGHDVYEAQFMPGYLGLCDLARRGGEVQSIRAKAVYESDEFTYCEGLAPNVEHVPSLTGDKTRAALRYVYAVAQYKEGHTDFMVMTVPEVEQHRMRSRAKDNGPWQTDYVAMALKTAVRQLCKWLPQSVELENQLSKEIEYDTAGFEPKELTPTNGREPFGFTKPVESHEVPGDAQEDNTPPQTDEDPNGDQALASEPGDAERKPETPEEANFVCTSKNCGAVFSNPLKGGLCPECLGKTVVEIEPAKVPA